MMRAPMPTDLEARVMRSIKDTGHSAGARAPGHGTRIYSQASQRCIRKGWVDYGVSGEAEKVLTTEGVVALENYDRRKAATKR